VAGGAACWKAAHMNPEQMNLQQIEVASPEVTSG
jgi:hypothetical protein